MDHVSCVLNTMTFADSALRVPPVYEDRPDSCHFNNFYLIIDNGSVFLFIFLKK